MDLFVGYIGILFSLLVGLGNGDLGNNDQNVTTLCMMI